MTNATPGAAISPQEAKARILEWGREPWLQPGELKSKLLSGTSPGVLLGVAGAGAALACIVASRPRGRAAVGGALKALLQPGVVAAVLPVLMDLWSMKPGMPAASRTPDSPPVSGG